MKKVAKDSKKEITNTKPKEKAFKKKDVRKKILKRKDKKNKVKNSTIKKPKKKIKEQKKQRIQSRKTVNSVIGKGHSLEQLKNQKENFQLLQKKLKSENIGDENENRCIFALRNNVTCFYVEAQKVLEKLNLTTHYTGTLLMNTKNTLKQLYLVQPYVCYGYINKMNFTNLMSKYLRLQIKGKEQIVNGNEITENIFKQYNFQCFEDLCNYIYKCEKNAEVIIKKHFFPFNFTFLKKDENLDFLQIEEELAGCLKDKINIILEKVC